MSVRVRAVIKMSVGWIFLGQEKSTAPPTPHTHQPTNTGTASQPVANRRSDYRVILSPAQATGVAQLITCLSQVSHLNYYYCCYSCFV
jgi:hypothetical protein